MQRQRILWVKTDFLHPTTRGGQIRTLEMLRCLHRRHEIHYVAFENPFEPEGLARCGEYCSQAYPIRFEAVPRGTPAFYAQVLRGLFSPVPLAVSRFQSRKMERVVAELMSRQQFDSVVCDFIVPSINIPDLAPCVLFQHNLETTIWERRALHSGALMKPYFALQAKRMLRYERAVCRTVRKVVAVSEADAKQMERQFGIDGVDWVSTGVAVEDLTPPADPAPKVADLVFVGSMDWMPNVDGMEHFVAEILPLIRRRKPDCSLAIVGRTPPRSIRALAEKDPLITVTGTVPDVRPYMWGASVFVVPLRIGGGTRLKIYEAMAARAPVVSTTVGAEGLEVRHPQTIRLADTPEAFAGECLELLESSAARTRMAEAAWQVVAGRFTWDRVTEDFERFILVGEKASAAAAR